MQSLFPADDPSPAPVQKEAAVNIEEQADALLDVLGPQRLQPGIHFAVTQGICEASQHTDIAAYACMRLTSFWMIYAL